MFVQKCQEILNKGWNTETHKMDRNTPITNHKPWPFEPVKVKFCFLRGPLRWLTAAKNAIVSWLLNFRIRMFVKSAVNALTYLYVTTDAINRLTIPFLLLTFCNHQMAPVHPRRRSSSPCKREASHMNATVTRELPKKGVCKISFYRNWAQRREINLPLCSFLPWS